MKHVTIRLADAEGVVLEERIVEGEFASIDDFLAWMVRPQDDMIGLSKTTLKHGFEMRRLQ